jgi:hypothetical protein
MAVQVESIRPTLLYIQPKTNHGNDNSPPGAGRQVYRIVNMGSHEE